MKKIVPISELKIGMFVNKITKSKANLAVKSKGMIRSKNTIVSLNDRGILELEIDLDKSEINQAETAPAKDKSEHKIAPRVENRKIISAEQHLRDLGVADKLYTQSKEIHSKIIRQLKSGQAPDFEVLNNLSQEIIDSIFANPDALACLVMLKESDNFLVEHGLNCSILLSLFASFKGFSQADTEDLTLAGLLMDCGMALLPNELMEGNNELSEADRTLIKTHVDIGYEIAERYSDLPPIVLDVIANHHERIDGSGYPKKRSDEQISLFAQMAAIVDCYNTMITERPYRSSSTAQESLELMLENQSYNTELVNEFIQAIGLYPVGSLVHLQSGKLAIVMQRNRNKPLEPIVMIFYSIKSKNYTETKRLDLKRQSSDKIIGSVIPDEFDINLPIFFRKALLPS